MNENRLPPGYVPLTIHELNGQSPKQNGGRKMMDGDRGRRSNNNNNKGKGRIKRRPRPDEREPIEE